MVLDELSLTLYLFLMLLIEGVALLPFVDERRLRSALADVYPDLTSEEGEGKQVHHKTLTASSFRLL